MAELRGEKGVSRIFAEYHVGDAVVRLRQRDNGLLYEVEEPTLTDGVKKSLDQAMDEYVKRGTDPEELVKKYSRRLSSSETVAFRYYLLRELRGFSKLQVFMYDDQIEDFTITMPGPVRLIHRLAPHYEWIESNIVVESDEELDKLVKLVVERSGGSITPASPVVEILTPSFDRVAGVLRGEVSLHSSITVRKFPRSPYSLARLVKLGTLRSEVAAALWLAVELKCNVIIAGLTGSGKTTLLNSLLLQLPKNYKIVTIEEHPEINLKDHPGWLPLYARLPTSPAARQTAIPLTQLLKAALRHRPTIIAVGEARAEEVQDMITAASVGHGTATTLHTDDLDHMVKRLTSHPMNLRQDQVALIDYAVFIVRMPDGRRRVKEVYENVSGKWELIYDYESGKFKLPEKIGQKLAISYRGLEPYELAALEVRRRAEQLRAQARREEVVATA
ncbi:MAG: type II/IV secretion system ATPase subunit [Nitrososphaerota archaeon]